jgi:hypothetical protein
MNVVITEKKYPVDLPDQFYYTSPGQYGGSAHLGEQVLIVSESTRHALARGTIIQEGQPYAECKTVQVKTRFI